MSLNGVCGTVSGAPALAADAASTEDSRLKEACRGVEGIFLAMLMKEGLKSLTEGEDNQSSHASAVVETTLEQVANQMAGTGSMGIARMLYEQVSGAAKTAKAEKANAQ